MNALIIFVLLFGLMLTGMPISISLGLTVLTFLFTMTDVPIQSVALKLFTASRSSRSWRSRSSSSLTISSLTAVWSGA